MIREAIFCGTYPKMKACVFGFHNPNHFHRWSQWDRFFFPCEICSRLQWGDAVLPRENRADMPQWRERKTGANVLHLHSKDWATVGSNETWRMTLILIFYLFFLLKGGGLRSLLLPAMFLHLLCLSSSSPTTGATRLNLRVDLSVQRNQLGRFVNQESAVLISQHMFYNNRLTSLIPYY